MLSDKAIFSSIDEALEDLRQGKAVIVADDDDRENEGDLICVAELISPAMVNFMAKEARGLICLALDKKITEELNLTEMVQKNSESMQTAFTCSIDAKGLKSGISAQDRAWTIKLATDSQATKNDFTSPGHVFPLIAAPGGVLRRVGHTEAAVDLARLAGFKSAGVICEILNSDGSMARQDDLRKFAEKFELKFINIADLVAYRLESERFVKKQSSKKFDAHSELITYYDSFTNSKHYALVYGDINKESELLCRIHKANSTEDLFGLIKNEKNLLSKALEAIKENGSGVIVYLQDETETDNKSASSKPMQNYKDYGVGAQIVSDLGLKKIKLLANNSYKFQAIDGYDIEISGYQHLD